MPFKFDPFDSKLAYYKASSSGSGTVTSVSVVSANGFGGTVTTETTTPAITLTTSINGILLGNGASVSAASTTGSGAVVLATSPTFATSITGSYLTASEILGTGASKEIVSLPVSTYPSLTELSYVKGLTSAVQTQLNTKAAAGTTITIAGTANQITSSAGAQDLSANRTWTLSFPSDVLIPTVLTVPNTGLHLLDTNATHDLIIKPGSNLTADRTLTFTTGDTDMIVDLTAVTDEYVLTYDVATNTWRGVVSASGGANAALSNLDTVAINTTLVSDTDNTDALGTTAIAWSDLFLGSGSIITFNSAPSTPDVTITHSAETLTFAGGTIALGTATATGGLTGNVTGNVSGTADTVTNATQASITTLANVTTVGTIGAGVWQGTTIKANYLQQAAADLGDADITVNLTNSNAGNVTNLTIDGAFNSTGLTASEIVITDASKNLVSAAVATYPSLTELSYVKGVTSAIQTQIDAKGVGDMTLAGVQTVTGAKQFGTIGGAVGKLILAGSTSGTSILNAAAVAGTTTLTLPGSTSTLAGLSVTQSWTAAQTFTMGTTTAIAAIFKGIASPLTSLTEWQKSDATVFAVISAQVAATADTGVFTFYDKGIAKSSDGAVISVHCDDQSPYVAKYYNETFSTTVPCMTYFAWNTGAFVFSNESANEIQFCTNGLGNYRMTINSVGRIGGNGITVPTAWYHFPAGVSAASGAPIKFTAGGVLLATKEAGTVEHITGAVVLQSDAFRFQGSANNKATHQRILYGATTDAATAVELTLDGGAGSGATNRISVPTDCAMSVVINICVKQTASANSWQMLRQFVISNNAGTTALAGAVTVLGTDIGSAGLNTVTTTITANNTDDCIKVEVNGVAATNLRYTAYIVSTETIYA